MVKTMDLSKKLYQNFVIDKLKETDWDNGNSGPLVIELDPTAVCDLACPGCISEDLVLQGNSFSNDRLMELGQEFIDCGVKAVVLIGGGEPLAHPKVGDFISLVSRNDIHIGITTNGTFIDKYIDEISMYSKWTRISLDAASNSVFSNLRPTKGGKSKFDKVINNMRMLAKRKVGKLGFSFLIQTEADGPGIISNTHEIYDAAVLAKDIGCDYFEVKPTYQFRDDAPHTLMIHNQVYMEEARKQIELLYGLEDNNFKIMKAINLGYSLDRINSKQSKSYKSCPSTHLRTTVTPTGVFICPYWRGKEKFKIGDVNNTNFSKLWKSFGRKELMNNLDISKECANIHCLRHETNKESIDIKNNISNDINIIPFEEFDRFI
jgi:MoaA/NifB/PqqE/SkfB family radical SAM enzyme